MDKSLFLEMAAMEELHWWFRGRRAIVLSLLDAFLRGRRNLSVADLGCGTGHMLGALSRFGNVVGMERSAEAIELAAAKNVAKVFTGHLPDAVPFQEESFDVIVLLDVLEHIERDHEAAAAARRLLRPGGILLATVPAIPSLYSARDAFHGHIRRYRKAELRECLASGDLEILFLSHYNAILFLPAALVRAARRIAAVDRAEPDLSLPPRPVNTLFGRLFGAERHWLGRKRTLPFGLSLVAVARRAAG